MATGGTPLARMLVTIVLLIAIPAVLISFSTPALAQDAASKLDEGLKLLRAGDPDSTTQAVKFLREALAMNPSSEEVMAALGRAEWRALINLMASGQAGANVAKALMDLGTPVLPEKAFNEAELKKLVTTAVTDKDYNSRFDAAMSLARTYGEFAVPYLVAYLSSSNTEYKINAHITLMRRIGRDAVLPLNEALQSGDANVRLLVASELGVIGDERSLPALAAVVDADEDGSVRAKASEAFQKLSAKFPWAADMTSSELYLRLARLYYAGDYRVMSYADRPMVVWSWNDGLKSQAVPRYAYQLELAEEACYDAMRADPANSASRAMLARVIASEKMASDGVGSDDDLGQSYAAGLANAGGLIGSMGWETLSLALGDAIDQHDHGAAAMILGVMPHVYTGADFTTDNPVVRATGSDSAGVRLAAAEAVLRINGDRRISAFPDPDGFTNLVAASAGEVIPRQILVVDSNDERRNKMLTELNKAKFMAYDARSGSDGVVLATRYVGLDLVIASVDLGDMDVLAFLSRLGGSDRTKDVPVVVVGTAEQAADDEWRNLYKDKSAGLAGVPDGPGAPTDAFLAAVNGGFGGESPGAAARYARSASVLGALAGTDTGNALFNWNSLTETLTGLLTADVPEDPPVRHNALRALANIGDPAAMGALVAFFGSSGDDKLKAAAGWAIAHICHANPVTLDDAAFGALLKGTSSGNEGVRMAAFAALGSADLTAEQGQRVAEANRPGTGGGGGGGDDGGDDDM